jgi:hypothetical protein
MGGVADAVAGRSPYVCGMSSGQAKRRNEMPQYVEQRTVAESLAIPVMDGGAELRSGPSCVTPKTA